MKNSNYNTKAWSPKSEIQKRSYTGRNGLYENKTKNFMNALSETRDYIYNPNISITENGMVGYKTSGSALLDLNFAVASLRGADDSKITEMFRKAFNENPVYAMRWLFFCRDARQGLGERNLFRVCVKDLAKNGMSDMVNKLIPVMAEYGRWDDMWELLNIPACRNAVILTVRTQMLSDNANYLSDKPVSLLCKWMPSANASSSETKKYANILISGLNMSPANYRKWLSRMRKYIDVVERKMSSDNWQAIDYETVPSKANLVYKNAFLKHDTERRRAYLGALTSGEAKINSSVNYPYDIVHKYKHFNVDATLEGLWKSLPDTVKGCGNTMVVADGSGSMCTTVGNSGVTALEVANSLAIYFAEHSSGEFKDKYITFSETPQLVDFSSANSLKDKLRIALNHTECANTNIEAVFNLILETAINNRMEQKDMPKNILIISDCEFDSMVCCGTGKRDSWGCYRNFSRPDATLFDTIKKKFNDAGYSLPRLVFWNVNSRTGTIPVKENALGVALVSGFSVNVAKMVMSGNLDPFECLLETINAPRYDQIESIITFQ